jgi:hypothetical protein
VFDRAKQSLLDRAKVTSCNRLPSRPRGGPVEQNANLSFETKLSAAQISVRSQLLMNVEFADKPWFYRTMTREHRAGSFASEVGAVQTREQSQP